MKSFDDECVHMVIILFLSQVHRIMTVHLRTKHLGVARRFEGNSLVRSKGKISSGTVTSWNIFPFLLRGKKLTVVIKGNKGQLTSTGYRTLLAIMVHSRQVQDIRSRIESEPRAISKHIIRK